MNPDKLLFLLHYGKDTTIAYYPDYSYSGNRDEFFRWLCRERPEMWDGFFIYALAYGKHERPIDFAELVSWLFFSDPSRPRDLMAEWLRLESVREKFGRNCELDCEVSCPSYKGACSGKIPAEWAKEE
jgi:hypothetical protein